MRSGACWWVLSRQAVFAVEDIEIVLKLLTPYLASLVIVPVAVLFLAQGSQGWLPTGPSWNLGCCPSPMLEASSP
jgi:hypothetical protein